MPRPTILLTGAGGMVGFELARSLAPLGDVSALDRAALDLADADAVVAAVRAAPYGEQARRIGSVTAAHGGRVALRTRFGTRRVLDMPVGELLPRIC